MFQRQLVSPIARWSAIFVGLALAFAPAAGFAAKEPKKRVAVVGFENKTGFASHDKELGQLGNALAEKLVEQLIASEKFIVLERQQLDDVLSEQKVDLIFQAKPVQEARLTSAQALIRGTVTDVLDTGADQGGLRIKNFKLGGKKRKVTVKVNVRIVDTVTAQVLTSVTVEGYAEGRNLQLQGSSKDIGGDIKTQKDITLGQAADQAIAKAVQKVVEGMGKIPWQGSVARVTGSDVFVNAGAQENVEKGMKLRVFQKGAALIDKETNENLGSLDEEIGTIEIVRVEGRFSVAKAVEGKGFAAGNIVKPVVEAQ